MEDIIDIIVTETTNLIEITSQPTDEVIDVNIIDNRENITLNVTPSVVEININQLTGNFGVLWGEITGTLSSQTDLQNALNLKADLVDGKVPSSQLPSYVDDVVEVANYASLPVTGEVGKIYITLDTNFIYRWTGSTYVEIKDSSAVWGAITGTLSNQTDLQNALNAKEPTITAGTTAQYWRGDKSWQTLNTTIVPEGTNLYYTDARARASVSAGTGISYSSSTGVIASTITQYTDALARAAVSLTTTGSNGSATYNSTTGVLNVPTYTLSGLGGQPLATNLTALAGLSFTSLGFIKMTGVGTLALDTTAYLPLTGGTLTGTLNGTNITITNSLIAKGGTFNGGASYGGIVTIDGLGSDLLMNRANTSNGSSITLLTNAVEKWNIGLRSTGATDNFFIYNSNLTANSLTINSSNSAATFASSVTASSFVKSGGTSSQFLKADGSVDSSTYLTTGTAASTYLPLAGGILTGALSGTSASFSSSIATNGITLSSWGNVIVPAFETLNGNSISSYNASNIPAFYLASNAYHNGTSFIRKTANSAMLVSIDGYNNNFQIQSAASSTVGSTISWTSRFNIDGSNGAATFSSSVTASGDLTLNGNRTIYLTNAGTAAGGIVFYNSTGSAIKAGIGSYYNVADEGDLEFLAGGSSTKMIIRSSGNVGIGTTSPFAVLTSQAPSGGAIGLGIVGRASDNYGLITFRNNDATTTVLEIGGSTASGFMFANYANTHTAFATNSTERMRITSAGETLIGRTSSFGSSYRLQVQGSADTGIYIGSSASAYTSVLYMNSAGAGAASIFTNNILYVTANTNGVYLATNGIAWIANSDERLKTDLTPIGNAINKVSSLRSVIGRYKTDEAGTKRSFLIAQDVLEVLPEAVTTNPKTGNLGVAYSDVIPLLVAAIKELKNELDALKA